MPEYDAELLISDVVISDFYDVSVKLFNQPKVISNWVMTEIMRKVKETPEKEINILITPENFVNLLKAVDEKIISISAAKTVFEQLWGTGKTPDTVIEESGLKQINNEGEIVAIVQKIIAENPKTVADYKSGNTKVIGFLVGSVMKQSGGKANPKTVNEILVRELNK